jgi:hypothetical protein
MADFNTSKIDGDTVGASEWNQLASIDNFISTSGQTPSTSNLNQTGIAAARYSSGGQFYTDSGIANAYVLSPVSPFKSPVSSGSGEGYFIGMTIRFRAGNANTGASTVNVNSAGVKNLKKEDGTTDLAAGDIPTNRDVKFRYNGTSFVQLIEAIFATTSTSGTNLLPSPITIANNASDANNDIDSSAGVFQFSDGSGQAIATALTKRLDANWAAGTNQGGLDTGTKAVSTWYHCYAIYNPTTLVSDFLFSTGATTPTALPSGFTKYKWVGAIFNNSANNINPFIQDGKKITYNAALIYDNTAIPTTPTNIACLTPYGIRVNGLFTTIFDTSATVLTNLIYTDPVKTSFSRIVAAGTPFNGGSNFQAFTNLTSYISLSKSDGNSLDYCKVYSYGWEIPDNLY